MKWLWLHDLAFLSVVDGENAALQNELVPPHGEGVSVGAWLVDLYST
jgi:hypothetical protein